MRNLVVLGQVRLGGQDGQLGVRALGVAAAFLLACAAAPAPTEIAAVHDGAQAVLEAGEAVDLGEGDGHGLVQEATGAERPQPTHPRRQMRIPEKDRLTVEVLVPQRRTGDLATAGPGEWTRTVETERRSLGAPAPTTAFPHQRMRWRHEFTSETGAASRQGGKNRQSPRSQPRRVPARSPRPLLGTLEPEQSRVRFALLSP